jgi:uncharacterized protein YcaQ
MKVKSVILSASIALMLVSCGNREHIYNEGAAARYWECSRQFENCYKEFSEGKFQTKFELSDFNKEYVEFSKTFQAAKNLRNNIASSEKTFDLLNPSAKAQAFHNKLKEFFELVRINFADAVQAYAELECECPAQKDSLSNNIHLLYRRISSVEDSALEEQVKYLESVGLKAKE